MKWHTGRSLLMASSLLCVATSLHADPIVVNFDNEQAGINAGFIHPAVAISSAETDGLRLVATASGFGIGPSAAATSPPHVAFGAAGLPAFFHDLIGTFYVPPVQARYVRAATDLVSFAVVGTENGQTEAWRLARQRQDEHSGVKNRGNSICLDRLRVRLMEPTTNENRIVVLIPSVAFSSDEGMSQ